MNMHAPVRATGAAPADDRGFVVRNRRALIIGVLVAVVALWGAFKFFGAAPEAAPETAKAPRVSVTVPGRVAVAAEIRVPGAIAARREMPVGVQGEGGMVNAVLVEAGDFVRAGQVMARLDRAVQVQQVNQLSASVQQARADLALSQSELDRALTLVEKGFISKADIDRRTATRDSNAARVRVVGAQLSESQARLARLDIRAPGPGLVLARAVEPGQIVGPGGSPLFRVALNGAMEMTARVAEQDLAKLRVGMPATVQLVGGQREFAGEVWLLEPVIDAQNRQGIARIALAPDPDLRVGAFANARIAVGTALQPVLPQSAILADAKGAYVYVVGADNKIARRGVTTGEVSRAGIAIASGLSGSERVVLSAGAFLNEGETVDPVSQRIAR
jgi:RND family efflux transporter MFP subunit